MCEKWPTNYWSVWLKSVSRSNSKAARHSHKHVTRVYLHWHFNKIQLNPCPRPQTTMAFLAVLGLFTWSLLLARAPCLLVMLAGYTRSYIHFVGLKMGFGQKLDTHIYQFYSKQILGNPSERIFQTSGFCLYPPFSVYVNPFRKGKSRNKGDVQQQLGNQKIDSTNHFTRIQTPHQRWPAHDTFLKIPWVNKLVSMVIGGWETH